jgi:hypothetical protein
VELAFRILFVLGVRRRELGVRGLAAELVPARKKGEGSIRAHTHYVSLSEPEGRPANAAGFAIPARVAHGKFVRARSRNPIIETRREGPAPGRASRGEVRGWYVLALLAPGLLLATGVAALVERVARDTWERTAGIGKKLVSDARRAKSMASVVHRRRLPRDAGDAPRARGGDRARYP